jgi:hypothetical protein
MWGVRQKDSKVTFRLLAWVTDWLLLKLTGKGNVEAGVKLFGRQDEVILDKLSLRSPKGIQWSCPRSQELEADFSMKTVEEGWNQDSAM